MEEQANKILVELLQKASNGIDAAVSFSQAQIPDVVHQLLIWSFVHSALSQVTGLLLLIAAIKLPSFARTARNNGERWTSFDGCPNDRYFISSFYYDICTVFAPVFGSIIGVSIIAFNFEWLKIWLAPKLFLIEYAASLVK
ncbi:hypothetical protein OHC98_07430 [Escherichia coli]|uniref:hypothetical protein n=1 Tax=Escherichia coli TaxID=562 RepID=UPI00079FE79A|nr:hypothetical protein [Escherichia coli]EJF4177495.1 hypothetical protein [Escherichia coli]KYV03639.1 hypothetical protein AML69_19850 [Escherichia coli]MCW7191115.1 hypothetical protein [Escherichia coli]MCW7253105.1 hypothetical protein [Escherichia coli]HAI0141703.1 hypothetical protein [Escherichia coli]